MLTVLARPRASNYQGLLLPTLVATAPSVPQNETGGSFRDRGFGFIPIRQAHLDFLAYIYDHLATTPLAEVEGYAMVDRHYLLLGLAIVHFEPAPLPDGSAGAVPTIYAHFGHWLKVYPKDILRQIHTLACDLRRRGLKVAYACADREVEGSQRLLQWARAEPLGFESANGPMYRLDLSKTPI